MGGSLHYNRYAEIIRLSVFLIAGLCAGLPALIWAVRSLHQLQGSGVRVSVFIASLLFSDALELLLIPFIVAIIFTEDYEYHRFSSMFSIMSIAVSYFGFCSHQLVALEGILSLKNPLCSSRLSSQFVSVPITITLGICASMVIFSKPLMVVCGLTFRVAVTTCILLCTCVLPSHSLSYRPTGMNPALFVTVISVFTSTFLYGPFIVCLWMCTMTDVSPQCFDSQLWRMSLSIMSMRLIADPLLCVLVCKKIPIANSSNMELHTDQGTD